MNICYRRLRPEREIDMEIKDMRAFYAIVEEGNISHAAQRLDIAQPALSRQMKRLETSLGVQLFERGSRRIRLTDAGRVLYSRVEHILGMVDGTVREITEIGSGIAGSIQLGTITTSGALLLPELISEFHLPAGHVSDLGGRGRAHPGAARQPRHRDRHHAHAGGLQGLRVDRAAE